jgi:hypothetical protein
MDSRIRLGLNMSPRASQVQCNSFSCSVIARIKIVVQSQRVIGLMAASGEFFGPMKNPNRLGAGAIAIVGSLAIGSWVGSAQEMVLPTHEVPSPDVAAEALQRDQPRLGWVKLGPFDIIPRFQSSVYYDDNIGAQDSGRTGGHRVDLGADPRNGGNGYGGGDGQAHEIELYAWLPLFFGDDVDDRNRVNHTAQLGGTLGGAKLSVGFDQRLYVYDGPGDRHWGTADRLAYTTRLTSQYL